MGGGYSPLTLTVTDADVHPNSAPFIYTIVSGDPKKQFSITEGGNLLARGDFNKDIQNKYLLKV